MELTLLLDMGLQSQGLFLCDHSSVIVRLLKVTITLIVNHLDTGGRSGRVLIGSWLYDRNEIGMMDGVTVNIIQKIDCSEKRALVMNVIEL